MAELFVVNNKQKGGPVSQLDKIDYSTFSLKKDNVFLDSLTGDYFIYNQEQKK